MKYLGIKLTKEAKVLNTEKYKALWNEIRENENKWKTFCVHELKDLIL